MDDTELDLACDRYNLTEGERKVLRAMLNQGPSNLTIAARLCVSPKTVKFHITNLNLKLGVRSRLQIIMRFKDFIIEPPRLKVKHVYVPYEIPSENEHNPLPRGKR